MGKSQETFLKKEKQKNKIKQRQEKMEKMQERKANATKGKSLQDMMAYLDENGNLTTTPQDFTHKRIFKQEEIEIGVTRNEADEVETVRTGIVTNFNHGKGFGFIKDSETKESVFVHVNNLTEQIKENDKVTFSVEHTFKGKSAIDVKKAK